MKISIIIPCRNEEYNIAKVYESLTNDLKDIKYEIIYIDDGSTDNTYREMERIYQKDKKHVKVISFARAFNKDAALLAGINYADGDYYCLFASKYYSHTKHILAMAEYLETTNEDDQVNAVFDYPMPKQETIMIRLLNKLSPDKISERPVAFRLIRRQVGEALLKVTEQERFTEGIFAWLGYHTKTITIHDDCHLKEVKVSLLKKWRYTITSLYKHTTKPLLLAKVLGIGLLLATFGYLVYCLIWGFMANAGVILLILFLMGMQFLCLGIIGNYLAQIYWETKHRPIYIIRDKLGFDDNIL